MPETFRKETLNRMDAFQRSVAKEFHDFYRIHSGKPAASSPTDSVNASSVETAESQGEKKITKKNDWKTFPMPAQRDTFLLSRHFSKQELSALQCGHIPEAMEDKWFWYMEGNTLFAHRSWTGYSHCVKHNRLPPLIEPRVKRPRGFKVMVCQTENQDLSFLPSASSAVSN